jgi:hypothetical protein
MHGPRMQIHRGDPSVNVPVFPPNETDLYVSQTGFLSDPLINELNFSLSSHQPLIGYSLSPSTWRQDLTTFGLWVCMIRLQ